jgi:GMP synthase-like glutamine amidotransferase
MSETTTTGGPRRALIIQHEEPTPPGLIQTWHEERGFEVDVLRIDERDPHDIDPRYYSLIVSLGSEFGAYQDDLEWIGHEMDFLKDATEADVPILGVCFGGQLRRRRARR